MLRTLFIVPALLFVSMVSASTSNAMDSKYFSRNVTFTMLKDKVVLIERNRPATVTMDEWPQLIFLSADGRRTVSEFALEIGRHYKDGMPPGLLEQTRDLMSRLSDRGYIVLHDKARPLPYYLATPIERQDMKRSRKLMEEDGFIDKSSK